MSSHRTIGLACAASLLLGTATCQSAPVHMNGPGAQDCSHYLSIRRSGNETLSAMYVSWAFGYISAYNVESGERGRPQVTLPADATILAYIDTFCTANPQYPASAAVANLVEELAGRPPRYPRR